MYGYRLDISRDPQEVSPFKLYVKVMRAAAGRLAMHAGGSYNQTVTEQVSGKILQGKQTGRQGTLFCSKNITTKDGDQTHVVRIVSPTLYHLHYAKDTLVHVTTHGNKRV